MIEEGVDFNKVIGIGLPKTATCSLTKVLCNNQIKTQHFGHSSCGGIREEMVRGIYKSSFWDEYRGLMNAFDTLFPQVDKEYPNSKFIYTIRKKEDWLRSIENHWKRMEEGQDKLPARIEQHLITFGTYSFNKDRFSFVYDNHFRMVNEYFKNRKEDVLTIDITKDEGCVEKICNFLNIQVIDNKMEYLNKGKY